MAALALEVEDGVDHVLEHAGPRDRAVLGDVADQQHGDAAALRKLDQRLRRGADLGDGAGRRVDGVEPHRLDGVDHRDLGRIGPLERGHDVSHRGGGDELHRRVREAQPLGAQADLVDGFLARDVGAGRILFGERGRHLQQQGRLADAGIAADQQRRSDDEAAAADTIELGDAALVARWLRRRAGEAGELQVPAFSAARQAATGRTGAGAASSVMVFHSPQLSQRPLHFDVTEPQLWQTKRLIARAIAQCSSRLLRHQPAPCSQQVSSRGWLSRRSDLISRCPTGSASAFVSASSASAVRAPAQG